MLVTLDFLEIIKGFLTLVNVKATAMPNIDEEFAGMKSNG